MSGSRRDRTGLEWLLREPSEAGSAAPAEDAGPDGAPAVPSADAPPAAGGEPEGARAREPWQIASIAEVARSARAGDGAAAALAPVPEPEQRVPAAPVTVAPAGAAAVRAPSPAAAPAAPPARGVVQAAPVAVPTDASARTPRNTRAHPRVRLPFEAHYRKGGETLIARGVNLSLGGMFIETTKYLPVGDVFQAQVHLPAAEEGGATRKLAIIAEVIWATAGDPEDAANSPPGMGCKFLDVDDKDLPYLKERIASVTAG